MQKFNSVLIVDDDLVAVYLIKRTLEKADLCHTVHALQNPEKALEFLRLECHQKRECPGLVIVDINMPFMDGFEFLEEFGKMDFANKGDIIVLILSTSTAERDIDSSKKYKARALISKPLTSEKLLAAIGNAQIRT